MVGLMVVLVAVPALALGPGQTVLVNRAPDGSHGNAGFAMRVSADGRCVVFVSAAAQLPGANGEAQIYLRDTVANTTTLVSATAGGAGGDDQSGGPDLTPDCRYVAFDSEASDLVAGGVPAADRHVYRRDLQTGTTVLVSRADGSGGALANRHTFSATISDDGDRVGFVTAASNLVGDDGAGATHWDVFVRDISSNDTIHASRNSADVAQDGSMPTGFYPSLSGDGTLIAFDSNAENLSDDDVDASLKDVFVKNLTTGALILVSRASGAAGAPANQGAALSEISNDGSRVAFASRSSSLPGSPTAFQVYVRDLQTNQTFLVSRDAAGNPGNQDAGSSDGFQISADGERVAFTSNATNLPEGGGDGAFGSDMFLADLAAGTVQLAARASDGTPAPTASTAAISGDGSHVGFVTGSGLVADDTDNQFDLYLHRMGSGTTPTPTATPSPTPTATGTAPPPAPPAPPARATLRGDAAFVQGTANDLYLACTTLDLYLVDVLPAGRRVAVTGAADLRLAGQTVQILLDGKPVGSAKIGSSGAFAARVTAPTRRKRARARYQARVRTTLSQRLRLVRRMVATTLTRSGSDLVLRGVVNAPRARRQPVIAVDRFLSCRRREQVKVPRVKPDRRGRFAVRIKVPAGSSAVLYRARTKVPPRAGRPPTKGTFTLPRAATVG